MATSYATTEQLAGETASRKSADFDLDTRLRAVEAKLGITPPVIPPVTPPTQPPVTPPVTPTTGAYGSGLSGDSRANLQVGWTNRKQISYRFRSRGGSAVSLRVQERGGPVYSGGNGGTIRCTIQKDNGSGQPDGVALATVTWSPGNPATHWEVWTLHTFGAPAALTAGGLYHLRFENVAADPVANYISLNGLYHFGSTPTPRTAAFSDDFAFMYGPPFAVQVQYVPIFDLAYADGGHDGSAYIGTLADRYGLISGPSNMVRETFKVSGGDRTVSKAHVRVKRISGTGDLTIDLLAGTTPARTATVPVNQIAVGAMPPGSLQGDTWAHVTFSSPITLVNGQSYSLRLFTPAGTTYTAVPIQQGSVKGLASRQFTDGDPQRTTDGGANWANLDPYWATDLQFWLD